MQLFAKQGFAATTVGQIEAAAGLKPRRGALYQHFPSKEALLQAAVQRYSGDEYAIALKYATIPIDDPRGLALLIGRWLLDHLDGQRQLVQVLERDGDKIPDIAAELRAGTDAAFAAGAKMITRWLADRHPDLDAEALSVVLFGGIINFRRSSWLLGPPLGLDDERFLNAFATLFASLVDQGRAAT